MRRTLSRRLARATVSILALAGAASPAAALNIVLNPDSSFLNSPNGAAALLGFQKAANYWNTTLVNDVTIRFDIHFDQLRDGVLGSTFSNLYDTSAVDTYRQMAATGTSALDQTAVANLRPLTGAGGVNYRGPGTDPTTGLLTTTTAGSVLDNNDTYNNLYIAANTATNKALGIDFDYAGSLFGLFGGAIGLAADADADITFSSTFGFDFDPTDGIDIGTYDFIGVAVHEMGHALGFVSGADDYDDPYVGAFTAADVDGTSVLRNLDLFRYGNLAVTADGTHELQLDPNRDAFFSVDARNPFNFNADLAYASSSFFATGRNFGDGQQASHWKDQLFIDDENGCGVDAREIGIMDPTSSACRVGVVTSNDLAAFDAIGYNLGFDITRNKAYTTDTVQIFRAAGLAGVVPEPATWAQMILGFGLVGAWSRRGRAVAAA